ncbi:MAG: UvrD-helicase domain-containing protein [bacterium]
MYFYADMHVHSKYSRATSKNATLEELAVWAQKKGITTIATGDFTHPAWFKEIKENLIPAEPGVFRLREDIEKQIVQKDQLIRFILSVEISTIYKKKDKTRKVHHLVYVPDFEAAEKFIDRLSRIGNLKSDGRPILGLDSRNLLEITLQSSEYAYIIPAHIWTPWFSVLGSKSGFDSIEECYGDLAEHIFAAETGLSSDPPMNWMVSKLDKYRLVSNSDAHSPSKLGREAVVFDTNPDYFSIRNALKTGEGYVGTIEFFPEEGKYHLDGHRKCNICLTPEETKEYKGICPVCNKPVTVGVAHRVNDLSDRAENEVKPPSTAGKVYSLIPLQEILSEIMHVGSSSKKVQQSYENLIQKLGSELSILQNIALEDISKAESSLLAEAISRLRQGKVIRNAGYDGEYGIIRLFEDNELKTRNKGNLLFDLETIKNENKKTIDKQEIYPQKLALSEKPEIKKNIEYYGNNGSILDCLDNTQQKAAKIIYGQLLIVAGPGSGKTRVLTHRIAYMTAENAENKVLPENCLAVTFTQKAAKEMQERLKILLPENWQKINIHTFHSLCFSILKEYPHDAGLNPDFRIANEQEKNFLLTENPDISESKARKLLGKISKAKRTQEKDDYILEIINTYQEKLKLNNLVDFDDLILLTVKMFESRPDIVKLYQERFKFISIDEYQDIDAMQYALIKLFISDNGNLCVIGDPNQAIYGFRGADISFFQNFKNDYPDACIINLDHNYRSTNTIVNASNQVINSQKILSKTKKNTARIIIHTAPTEQAEAEFVVHNIEKMIGGHSFFSIDSNRSEGEESDLSFSDFAVLYRTYSQSEALIKAFKRSGMPFVALSNALICNKEWVKTLLKSLEENFSQTLSEQIKTVSQTLDNAEDHILSHLIALAEKCSNKDQFFNEIAFVSEIDTLDERADRISLLTLHASKGLEFKVVFIVGLEDGILPLHWAQNNENFEEEKRLFYVGMTRAKERLFLTRALKRKWQGTFKNLPTSPFLEKIQQELLKHSRFEKNISNKETVKQLPLF